MKFSKVSAASLVGLLSVADAFSTTRPGGASVRVPFRVESTAQKEEVTTYGGELSSFADSSFTAEAENKAVPVPADENEEGWQMKLEELLDPMTPLPKRQILLSELLSSNGEIRESVQAALRDRKIDSLLTPTGKKLQEGTQAVARQITNDILPGIAATASSPKPPADLPGLVGKVGSRVFNAFANQAKTNLELLQGDLRDPSRIPQRLQDQTSSIAKEARNIWSDTPEDLEGPDYTVVSSCVGYEVREYPGYTVASTNMATIGETFSMDDLTSGGAAFNALAAYLFGANDEGKTMDMTTPVTITSTGEMRFYLKEKNADALPQPLEAKDDDSASSALFEKAAVQIQHIRPARLAVARFTGFVTEGEIQRQKDALLTRLQIDGIEIDVPHGAVVPHVVFQYNPPYTIPIVRRNEIGVPVRMIPLEENAAPDLKTEWEAEEEENSQKQD